MVNRRLILFFFAVVYTVAVVFGCRLGPDTVQADFLAFMFLSDV